MTSLRLLVLVATLVTPLAAFAQEQEAPDGATISSAQVSGISEGRLSPGLRRDIEALANTALDRARLQDLAARIEQERPGVAAAVRAIATSDGTARVVFFVAQVENPRPGENVNERYTVESATVEGFAAEGISQPLRDDMQALVGTRVDYDAADAIADRLRGELPGYEVDRRWERGTTRGQLRLVFDVEKGEGLRWLHFAPNESKFLYHSKQGWGGLVNILIGADDWRVTPIVAIDNRDDLVEEYSGFGGRVENRRVGTERLGVSLELTWFDQTWLDSTLAAVAANPAIPEPYDSRLTVTPSAVFALTQHLRVGGGVSITELEPLSGVPSSQMANVGVLLAGYEHAWPLQRWSHHVDARFEIRAGREALQSDLEYTRYFGRADYWFRREHHTVLLSAQAGRINSDGRRAPLFERFTLGDSSTLRGWNKYDIAPAGAERVFHTSVEYRNHGFAFFFDAGSVWDRGTDAELRTSTGLGFHSDGFFMTLGFPLNTDDLDVVFMTGVRVWGGWNGR